jgi:hypothetical protein
MTKEQKIIRAKAGLLELARQLGNVSQACKMMGYSRDSFYRFKELYDAFSSSNSPSLAKTACGSRPASKPSRVSFLIAIYALHRRHYGPHTRFLTVPAVRTRGHFPTDEAAIKLLYLVLRQIAQTWKMPPREWCEAKTQFAIMFDDRFVNA